MHSVAEIFSNNALLCAFVAWAAAQAIKGLTAGIRFHDWSVKAFFDSGGMPSSHTSAVVALAMRIGFSEGFSTPLFAVSGVFAMVVMYDAAGVRREAGKQGKIIKELLSINRPDGKPLLSEDLKERIGHTPLEVIMGALLGLFFALLFSLL
jgi:hypothetical protein